MENSFLKVLLIICFICFSSAAENISEILNDECLRCICMGTSFCNTTFKCTSYGDEGSKPACGPFQITEPYWEEAGKPGGDFISCVTSMNCSKTAMTTNMAVSARDCDGDDKVTCSDIARIHMAGAKGCHEPWVTLHLFWEIFEDCNTEAGTEPPQDFAETRALLRGN
ncbi:lysozyme [Galendromus occidentalis]|uniref:lysozyme n=1 Tax=Galendromus occidentalis TaxID=34638 RepID=A0AAJ6QNV3_9ACAR|nr:lysozyme [Galendromus occidentalis]